jgi:hypothetical protein
MSDNHSIRATTNSSHVDRWLAYGVFRFTSGINILIPQINQNQPSRNAGMSADCSL